LRRGPTTSRNLAPTAGLSRWSLPIEPEHANVVDDAARARALLDALQAGDQLKVIPDPANLWDADRPQHDVLQEAFDLLGADLAIAHAKDRQHDGKTCALGRGVVDFDAYFGLLQSVGFSGPVIMHGFEETEAAESTAFARAKLREVQADALRGRAVPFGVGAATKNDGKIERGRTAGPRF
jgi:sugar phosphate isomerase/epimerase